MITIDSTTTETAEREVDREQKGGKKLMFSLEKTKQRKKKKQEKRIEIEIGDVDEEVVVLCAGTKIVHDMECRKMRSKDGRQRMITIGEAKAKGYRLPSRRGGCCRAKFEKYRKI